MLKLRYLLPLFITGFMFTLTTAIANPSPIHYRTSHEQFDDCLDDEEVCEDEEEEEHKRWYHSHRYRDSYDDSEDPTEELEHDASWPGKRDDSWDQLFR